VITSLLEPEDNNRFKMPVETLILGLAVTVLYLMVKDLSGRRRDRTDDAGIPLGISTKGGVQQA